MLPHQTELMFILGFAAQWLRAYKWYTDWLNTLLALVLALAVSFGDAQWHFSMSVIYTALTLASTVLGGTFTAHQLSHAIPDIVPKFNSKSDPQ